MDRSTTKINSAKAQIYAFLSLLYRDEIPLPLLEKMTGSFLDHLIELQQCFLPDNFALGLAKITTYLEADSAPDR
ncbi:MAG: hypothetical protein D3923_06635 [Candidatus Electrothrix sp. AR3]|nr:hypothetical protein [Candidatus Electrothrix sp. AR3]